LPLVLATLTRPALYDGLRHFMFATVLLAVPVGAGCAWCVRSGGWRPLRTVGLAVFLALAAVTAADMIRLHPYQTVFFNRSVAGGLAGAAGRWDTDYWGNSFREGALWLVNHVPTGTGRPRVASSAYPTLTEHYLPRDRFEYIGSVHHTPLELRRYDDPPDYYISYTRSKSDQVYPGRVLYRVVRDGVTLLVVVKVDRERARLLAVRQ
jgi:hypothetical protein